tara:strand:- start:43 stop:492 length:450 start_codon:yes stop_codon:yes gene_type:complete
MPLTKEERIELLKKAREAKKVKADAKKAEKLANPPKKGRPAKVKEEQKTLDLTNTSTDAPPFDKDDVFEIEEVVEVKKVKKPKKIVRKRIIQEYESGTDEEEEIIEEAPVRRAKPPQARVREVERPVELQKPREVDITQSTPQFNFFGY